MDKPCPLCQGSGVVDDAIEPDRSVVARLMGRLTSDRKKASSKANALKASRSPNVGRPKKVRQD